MIAEEQYNPALSAPGSASACKSHEETDTFAAAAAESTPGFIYQHISAREVEDPYRYAHLTVLPGGLRVKKTNLQTPPPAGGGLRSYISGFSEQSRHRLMQLLAAMDWGQHAAFFVTLTYHQEWGSWANWKANLKAFRERLYRRYGDMIHSVLWKLEFQEKRYQERGELAPHFHLVVVWNEAPKLGSNTRDFRRWLGDAWCDVVDPGDAAHRSAGTQAVKAENTSGPQMLRLMRYLSKYLGKTFCIPEGEQTGRCWGKWGQLPVALIGAYSVVYEDYAELLRRVREWGGKSSYLSRISDQWQGFLILGDGRMLGGAGGLLSGLLAQDLHTGKVGYCG